MIPIEYAIIVLFIVLVFQFCIVNTEVTAPAFLWTASFLLCFCSAYVLREDWMLEFLELDTIAVVLLATAIVISIDLAVRAWGRAVSGRGLLLSEMSLIDLPKILVQLTIVLNLGLTLWSLVNSGGIGALFSSDLNAVMADFKETISYGESGGLLYSVVSQLGKLSLAFTYCELFIIINNHVIIKREKLDYKSHRALFVTLAASYILFRLFFRSSRQSSIFLIVGALTMYYLCLTMTSERHIRSKGKWKMVMVASVVTIVFLFLFYYLGRMVGRKVSDAALDASLSYLSTGVFGLNTLIKEGYSSIIWGQMTFAGAQSTMEQLGIWPTGLESFSMLPFFAHGNTVTILGRWYWDFGLIGTLLFTALLNLSFSLFYYRCVRSWKRGFKRNASIVVYGFLVHIFYFAGYDDFSFNLWTTNYILQIITIVIVYYFIFKEGETKVNSLHGGYSSLVPRSYFSQAGMSNH